MTKNLLFQIELCHFASLSHYNPHNDMEKIAMAGALMLSKRPLEGLQPSEPGLENDENVSLELPDIGHSIPPLAFVKEEKIASTFEWLCFANVINQEYISKFACLFIWLGAKGTRGVTVS